MSAQRYSGKGPDQVSGPLRYRPCGQQRQARTLAGTFVRMFALYRSLALLAVLLQLCASFAGTPIHRRLTMADGLPSNSIYMIIQDRHGLIWLATDAGVSRFDGRSFRNYGLEDGLPDADILRIHEDSQGRIWCLGFNGKLGYLLDGVVHNASTDPYLAEMHCPSGCHSVVEDKHGTLWFGSVGAELLSLDRAGRNGYWQLGVEPIAISLDGQGELQVVTGRRIQVLRNGKWLVTEPASEHWSSKLARPASSGRTGSVAISARGVERVVDHHWQLWLPMEHTDPEVQQNCWLDDHGVLWIRMWRRGLRRVELDADGALLSDRSIFPDEAVNHVFTDRDGNVWFATARNGVKLCSPGQELTAVHRTRTAPFEGAFLNLHRDKEGAMWVGSALGQVFRFHNGMLSEDMGWQRGRGMGRVLSFEQGRNGVYYAGGDNGTYYMRHGGKEFAPLYKTAEADHMIPAKDMALDADGDIWVAGFGLYTSKGTRKVSELREMSTSLGKSRLHRLACTPDGSVFFSVHGRLFRFDGEQDHELHVPGLGPSSTITDLRSDGRGGLYVATSDRGLLRWCRNEWKEPLTVQQGMVSDHLLGLRLFGDTVVICTARGVQVLRMDGPAVAQSWHLGIFSILATEQVNDAWMVGDRLYVATVNGLCDLPFPPPGEPPFSPVAYLASITVNGVAQPLLKHLRVNAGERVGVVVHALDYAPLRHTEYQYRLDSTAAWSDAESGNMAFAGLGKGMHALAMRVRRTDGAWSRPTVLNVEVIPPWWDDTILKLSALLVLVAITAQIVRTNLSRRYERVLELQRQRSALDEERRRIAADVHDDLGAELSSSLMQARVAAARAEVPEARTAIARLELTLGGAIGRIDEIIWSLDPQRDTLHATMDFIDSQAVEYLEGHGIRFRTQRVGLRLDRALGARQRRELWLIVREALRNVVKHAQAQQVDIGWEERGDAVHLRIADDGVGLAGGAHSVGRSGVRNMRERAERLGARFALQPNQPAGTALTLSIPLAGLKAIDKA